MDIEFHYYQTYLIAKKAGFSNKEAKLIAHSSQYVDDNNIIFEINKDTADYYMNYISQTMNILEPKSKLLRIYPLFHFIPGKYDDDMARRKDGKMHRLNTTPNSENAQKILDEALKSGNLYRIGIAAHAYVDTFAHQNFIGYFDNFNAMKGMLEEATPNIGHADAKHDPDWPGLTWNDSRLVAAHELVVNKDRFIQAARELFYRLARTVRHDAEDAELQKSAEELVEDLSWVMSDRDDTNELKAVRVERCKQLCLKREDYGLAELVEFDEDAWFDEVVNEDVRGLRDRDGLLNSKFKMLKDKYTWKDAASYKQSDWYKFQEAVKEHQAIAISILDKEVFSLMELEGF